MFLTADVPKDRPKVSIEKDKGTLLIVDDDSLVRKTLVRTLSGDFEEVIVLHFVITGGHGGPRMLSLVARTFRLLVFHFLICIVDRISRLPRNTNPPDVLRILCENVTLKAQVRELSYWREPRRSKTEWVSPTSFWGSGVEAEKGGGHHSRKWKSNSLAKKCSLIPGLVYFLSHLCQPAGAEERC